MTMTTYTVTMDDGSRLRLRERSAAVAIQRALEDQPGKFVKACRSGLTEEEARVIRSDGRLAMAGVINYDIPDHVAVVKRVKAPKAKKEKEPAFFTDEEMGVGA